MRPLPLATVALALLAAMELLPTPLASQAAGRSTVLDEGGFALLRNGERVGHETFSIRMAPPSAGSAGNARPFHTAMPGGLADAAHNGLVVAQATLLTGTRRDTPSLNADTTGAVLRYQNETRLDGKAIQSYTGQLTHDHYTGRLLREDGESAREFRLAPGTVAVEDAVIHHLWFLARRGPGAVVTALVPGRNVVETIHVESLGTERITIDVSEIDARHLRLRTEQTGVTREVWVDTRGRLLKAVLPALNLIAVRDEAPRP